MKSVSQIARDAFNGKNPGLMEEIKKLNGYVMDGITYPANSISLSETISTVQEMLIEGRV